MHRTFTDAPSQLRRRPRLHPARVILMGFGLVMVAGTGLLMLPFSKVGAGGASLMEAFFTAVSAITVTGLIIVDTPTYWTFFGQVVILVLIQIGGFGVMVLASVIGIAVARKLSLQEVELQDGPHKRDYLAREVVGDEKALWWERAVRVWPGYADYQKKTDRQIPVFVLEPMR